MKAGTGKPHMWIVSRWGVRYYERTGILLQFNPFECVLGLGRGAGAGAAVCARSEVLRNGNAVPVGF